MHVPLCKREWVIRIPDKYISPGTSAKRFMELGAVNLEVILFEIKNILINAHSLIKSLKKS